MEPTRSIVLAIQIYTPTQPQDVVMLSSVVSHYGAVGAKKRGSVVMFAFSYMGARTWVGLGLRRIGCHAVLFNIDCTAVEQLEAACHELLRYLAEDPGQRYKQLLYPWIESPNA